MILIDKAKLMNHIENESRLWGEDYDNYQILGDIEDFDTVEAIPISWIEKKIAKSKEFPNSDDISDCYQLNISEVWEWLLEDWRKENETNNI